MLEKPRNLHANTAEENASLIYPSENAFPPSNLENDEIQIAGLLRNPGLRLGRIFSLDVDNKLGSSYEKLKSLQEAEEGGDIWNLLPQVKTPSEEAVDALDPNKFKTPQTENLDPTQKGLDPSELRIYGSNEGQYQFGEPVPNSVYEDSVLNEEYLKHITIGDGEMDRIMQARIEGNSTMKDGMIAGIRAVGKGGDDKIPDEIAVRGMLDQFGEEIRTQLIKKDPAQLEKMTLRQLSDMGDLLGIDSNVVRENFMGGLQIDRNKPGSLAAQMIAGKNLLIKELTILDKITDEAQNAPLDARPAIYMAWRQQAELVAQLQNAFKGTQTDIARALAALRVPTKQDADLIKRDVQGLLNNVGGSEGMETIIETYSKGGSVVDRLELAKALTKKATKWDAAYEVWINGILSGYWSHVKNIAGGVAMVISDDFETFVAAGTQAVTKGIRGQERDVTFGDLQAKMFGQFMAMREAVIASGKAGWYREDPAGLGFGSKIDSPSFSAGPDAFSAEGMQATSWGKTINFAGNVLTLGRIPMRALQAEDAFFKVVSYRGALYEDAYRMARQEGLKGDAFSSRIADILHNPPANLTAKAQDTAKYNTLQSEMEGGWKDMQTLLRRKGLRWMVPFYKTPTNAVLYLAERTLLAPKLSARYKAAVEAGGEELAKAQARVATGSAIMAMVGMEMASGEQRITGGISSDSRVRSAYERQGIKPYHIKLGDNWYPYNSFEPVSTIIGVVADTMEIINNKDSIDDQTALNLAMTVAGAIGYNMTNKTFMAGISKVMDAVRDPKRRSEAVLKQYLGSLVPGSAAFNDLRKLNDDLKRIKKDILDPMKAKLPGFSEDLGIKRDLWGRPISEVRVRSPYKPNAMDAEIVRGRLKISDHPEDYDADIEYTVAERDFFLEQAGKFSQEFIGKMMGLKNDPRGDFGPRVQKFKKLQKAHIATKDQLIQSELEAMFNAELIAARKLAKRKLLADPKLGPGLIARIRERDSKLAQKIREANDSMKDN